MITIPLRLNLASATAVSETIAVGEATRATVHIQSSSAWVGGASLRLSLSTGLDRDKATLEKWVDFETAVTFSGSTLLLRGINVADVGHIRLEITTSDPALGNVNVVVILS